MLTSKITLVQFILIKKDKDENKSKYGSISNTEQKFADTDHISHTHTAVLVLFVQAERDRVSKHLKEQDLLLDTARRNIQAELQGTISEKLVLQKEL